MRNAAELSPDKKETVGLDFAVGRSPLHLAVILGSIELVHLLLSCGARVNINRTDQNGDPLLHAAIKSRRSSRELLELLVSRPDAEIHQRDASNCSAFQIALKARNVDVAKLIYNKDASVASAPDSNGLNALQNAILAGDTESVFILIQIGVDLKQKTKNSDAQSVLQLAVEADAEEQLLRSLILAGAEVAAVDGRQRSVLHSAVLHDRPHLINCLVELGANPNALDAQKCTPLSLAVSLGNQDCLERLLAQPSILLELANARGQRPVHMLAVCDTDPDTTSPFNVSVQMLEALVKHQPAPQLNVVDASGHTPLMMAFKTRNSALCHALVEHGATLGTIDAEGISIFTRSLAKQNRPTDLLYEILDGLTQEPAWTESPVCTECRAKFAITVRPHHCRHCGRILCSRCSTNEMPIFKFGITKPVRTCDICFDYLNNPL